MKQFFQKRLKSLGMFSLLMLGGLTSQAYNFKVDNIYYNYISGTSDEVEVTYCVASENNGRYYTGHVTIPSTVQYNNNTYKVTTIGERAFEYCESMIGVTIPNSVTKIGREGFYHTGLIEVEIPSSVTYIGALAFQGSASLKSAKIPGTVEKLIGSTFNFCTALENIDLGYGIKEIGQNDFYSCTSLKSIEIPASIIKIDKYAFEECTSLNKVIIRDLDAWFKIDFPDHKSNPTYYGAHFYLGDSEIINLKIPETITELKRYALYTNYIESIEIPNSVNKINSMSLAPGSQMTKLIINDLESWCNVDITGTVFDYPYSLYLNNIEIKELKIPESITEVKSYTFRNCHGITSVEIPNSITKIGSGSFNGCKGLTNLTIGNSVAEIKTAAFYNCSSLKTITSRSNTPPLLEINVFNNVETSSCNLFVPFSALASYQSADVWNTFNIEALASNGNFTAQNQTLNVGKTLELPINLSFASGKQTYSGFQFDVEMPEGLSITDVKLSSELQVAGFTSKNSSTDGNPVRVISFESQGKGVTTTDAIVTLTIKADENATNGEKIIKLSNAILSSPTGSDIYLDDSEVTVTVKNVPVTSISLNYVSGKSGDLYVNDSVVYSATVSPADATDNSVTWSIDDQSVASITPNASQVTVKALKIGQTTLKATANDGSGIVGTATIKVVATPISSVSISSTGNKTSLYPQETLALTASVSPTTATTPVTYTWKSDNTGVVTISGTTANATITAVKTGTANITVTATNQAGSVTSAQFRVTVTDRPITSVTLNPSSSLEKYINETFTITATVNPSNATNPVITWSSTQPSVAKVDNGKVTTLAIGSTVITATASNGAGSRSASITVNVIAKPATSVTVTGAGNDMKVTQTMQLSAQVLPADATYKDVEWTSSDVTKATVNDSGLVTAVAAGNVTITAKVKNTTLTSAPYAITITDYVEGDANDDGHVTVSDVVTIVNYINQKAYDNFNFYSADVTKDGNVRVDDAEAVSEIILGGVVSKLAKRGSNLVSSDGRLIYGQVKDGAFGRNVEVRLEGIAPYSSLQADILLPEGSTLESITMGAQADGHMLSYNVVDGNVLKVVLYSFDHALFGKAGELMKINLGGVMGDATVRINNIYASDGDANLYSLDSENKDVAGISGIYGDEDGLYRVYTVQGIKVLVTSDASELDNLEPGIYIVNGKKVMISK